MGKTSKGDSLDCVLRDTLFEWDTVLLFCDLSCNSCIEDAPKGSDGLYFARPSRDCRRRSYEIAEKCWDGLWAVSLTCRILYRCKSLKASQFVRKQCGIEEKNTFVTI